MCGFGVGSEPCGLQGPMGDVGGGACQQGSCWPANGAVMGGGGGHKLFPRV